MRSTVVRSIQGPLKAPIGQKMWIQRKLRIFEPGNGGKLRIFLRIFRASNQSIFKNTEPRQIFDILIRAN